MGTITRTVTGTATREVSTATLNGWDLNFTTEASGDTVNVTVSGRKGNSYLNGYANSEPTSNIGFSQGNYDSEVADAVVTEMEAIVSEAQTEEG